MEKIKKFIECLVPVTVCNIKCSYCYIVQQGRRTDELPKFEYTPEHIGKSLSKERLGGTCYISICGAGETLVPKEITSIIYNIIIQGHYVNVTTNGTISKRFKEIVDEIPRELLKRLHFSFSFHYIELKRIGKVEQFFENIKIIKEAGCSFVVQLNLCDEYIPYLDEIKNICKLKVGEYPQLAATRNLLTEEITLKTEYSADRYKEIGSEFKSQLFDFTMDNFMVRRKEFCYAGDWAFILNLGTGEMQGCYSSAKKQNIFKDISKPIKFEAIGNNCNSVYCINSSHFMSLGVIPALDTPSYAQLRNRQEASWYSKEMQYFLNSKLIDSNFEYNKTKKYKANLSEGSRIFISNKKLKMKKMIKKIIKINK